MLKFLAKFLKLFSFCPTLDIKFSPKKKLETGFVHPVNLNEKLISELFIKFQYF